MIKVIVVDDQSLMCDGLEVIINSFSGIEVLACAENGEEALKLVEKLKPDLVIMDIRMPVMDGVTASKIIKDKYPEVKILLLTTFDDEDYIINAMSYGVSGYIFKDIEKEKLNKAIVDCVNGTFIMPSKVAEVLARKAVSGSSHAKKENSLPLTEREMEIALMIADGFTNRQIASALYISDGTVKNYVSNIYSKLGIKDRTKLAIYIKSVVK
ncbi:response regulator [Clostridium hydrogenum]|uniref:response regulator n=1 Tax=Clostridium hydrogenum TaxID=2855764 RepID=UPI001F4624C2|nr:response regulator transcription factor [Clostridium hydrogenum]